MANFRSTYYEKVGYRGVEEKKNIEILLKDRPIDRIKLKLFCLKFSVPREQRPIIWSLVTQISPVYDKNQKYVKQQREAVFDDLLNATYTLRLADENTPRPQVYYMMWLLETRQLPFGKKLINVEHPFVAICGVLTKIFDNNYEVWWIAKQFYGLTLQTDMECLRNQAYIEIKNQDPDLFRHLEKYNILKQLPIVQWFRNCFAGLIIETALVRIWDKIFGGSNKILLFLLIKMLMYSRMKIINADSIKGAMAAILSSNFNTDQEVADLIVNKAIDLHETTHTKGIK